MKPASEPNQNNSPTLNKSVDTPTRRRYSPWLIANITITFLTVVACMVATVIVFNWGNLTGNIFKDFAQIGVVIMLPLMYIITFLAMKFSSLNEQQNPSNFFTIVLEEAMLTYVCVFVIFIILLTNAILALIYYIKHRNSTTRRTFLFALVSCILVGFTLLCTVFAS